MREHAILISARSIDNIRIEVPGKALTVSASKILEWYEADKAGLFGERQPEHGRLSEDSTRPKPQGYEAVLHLLQSHHMLRGMSLLSAAEGVHDAIDAIALDVGRREVANWFDPRDITGTRLWLHHAGCRPELAADEEGTT